MSASSIVNLKEEVEDSVGARARDRGAEGQEVPVFTGSVLQRMRKA